MAANLAEATALAESGNESKASTYFLMYIYSGFTTAVSQSPKLTKPLKEMSACEKIMVIVQHQNDCIAKLAEGVAAIDITDGQADAGDPVLEAYKKFLDKQKQDEVKKAAKQKQDEVKKAAQAKEQAEKQAAEEEKRIAAEEAKAEQAASIERALKEAGYATYEDLVKDLKEVRFNVGDPDARYAAYDDPPAKRKMYTLLIDPKYAPLGADLLAPVVKAGDNLTANKLLMIWSTRLGEIAKAMSCEDALSSLRDPGTAPPSVRFDKLSAVEKLDRVRAKLPPTQTEADAAAAAAAAAGGAAAVAAGYESYAEFMAKLECPKGHETYDKLKIIQENADLILAASDGAAARWFMQCDAGAIGVKHVASSWYSSLFATEEALIKVHKCKDAMPPAEWESLSGLERLRRIRDLIPNKKEAKVLVDDGPRLAAEKKAREEAKRAREVAEREALELAKAKAAGFETIAEKAVWERTQEAQKQKDRESKLSAMGCSEALDQGLTSGIRAGYGCHADRWGNCTGCREHDI